MEEYARDVPEWPLHAGTVPLSARGNSLKRVLNFRVAAPSRFSRVGGFAASSALDLPSFFQFGENQLGNFAQGLKHALPGDGDGLVYGLAFNL